MKTETGPFLLAIFALALSLPLAQGAAGEGAERSYFVHPSPAGAARGPFSDAIRTGNTLYLGGHLGIDPHTGLAPPDRAIEARLLMDAMQRTLAAAGLKMDDLVYVTVISTDLSRSETFDAVYRSYFHAHYPARGFVGASALLHGAHFEVLGVAVKPARLQL
jgi:2-iminobutanoate/2-iminopropanoate deaminase